MGHPVTKSNCIYIEEDDMLHVCREIFVPERVANCDNVTKCKEMQQAVDSSDTRWIMLP